MKITPKRLELLTNIKVVAAWPDGSHTRRTYGRHWKVDGDVGWLLAAGLIEPDPETVDLDVKGYRRTAAGDAAVAAARDKQVR